MLSVVAPSFLVPNHPPPLRHADDVELTTDPAARQHVVVYIHDLEVPVHKSDGRTVLSADPVAFERACNFCFKALIKILFVVVAAITSAIFIQTVATVTWMEELAVLPVGVLLVFMFFTAYALCVAPALESTTATKC